MVKFVKNWYDARERKQRFFCASGDNTQVTTYILVYDKETGCPILEENGVRNLYDEIQSHRESCDLALILQNLSSEEVNGMLSTYSFDDLLANSQEIDFTSIARNPGDLLNQVKKAEQLFEGLPPDVRKLFNYSPQKFVMEYGSEQYNKQLAAYAQEHGFIPMPDTESQIAAAQLQKAATKKKVTKKNVKKEIDEDE